MIRVLYLTSIKWDVDPSRIFMPLGADTRRALDLEFDSFSLRQLAMAAARALWAPVIATRRAGYFLKDKSKLRPA